MHTAITPPINAGCALMDWVPRARAATLNAWGTGMTIGIDNLGLIRDIWPS
jgi:hypothetical protein